jgi:CRISPR-associated protein Cas5t
LGLAVVDDPVVSTILRTTWRIKIKKTPPGTGNNKKPDYQELLTGLKLYVCVGGCPLVEKLKGVAVDSKQISRFGGLSLGESRDLVNDIVFNPEINGQTGKWLVNDPKGKNPLPVWVDHVGSKGTVWRHMETRIERLQVPSHEDQRWIAISNH